MGVKVVGQPFGVLTFEDKVFNITAGDEPAVVVKPFGAQAGLNKQVNADNGRNADEHQKIFTHVRPAEDGDGGECCQSDFGAAASRHPGGKLDFPVCGQNAARLEKKGKGGKSQDKISD